MQRQFLINGSYDGQITPLDRGYAYGDGVFRTLPVRNGRPECWQLHYGKLREDCLALNIACPSGEALLADIGLLCEGDDEVVVKIIVTRGDGARGYAVAAQTPSNRALLKSPYPQYRERHFSHGVNLHLCSLRLARQPRLAGIKHLNRLENVLARMEWDDPQLAEGLLLDTEGNVIECTASNLFLRKGDVLVTPDLGQCGVAGVTRQRILDLAPGLGYRTEIRSFSLANLLQADEVVICNSLYGAWQVRALQATAWPLGGIAARLRRLLQEADA